MKESGGYPRIVFVGVHTEAEPPFEYLLSAGENVVGLVTLREKSKRHVSGAVDLATRARAAGVPVLEVRNVNDDHSVEWIRALRPDLILVIGWTQLLKTPLLSLPTVACLGFHASLLPSYRGRAPVNWAILRGETETGNTMIVLEPGADEGDIVAQRRIPILYEDDCRTVYEKVSATEIDMLREVLPLVREGRLPRRVQDSSEATIMPKRRPEDGRIDWNTPRRRLYDWVRALTHPYPGAFTDSASGRVWIWTAEEAPEVPRADDVAPGTVGRDPEGRPIVAAADGWLRPLRVQLEDGEELDAIRAVSDYLRPGSRLGGEPVQEGP